LVLKSIRYLYEVWLSEQIFPLTRIVLHVVEFIWPVGMATCQFPVLGSDNLDAFIFVKDDLVQLNLSAR